MEKRRAHYDLNRIKAQFSNPDDLKNITIVARDDARSLGFSNEDISKVIQDLTSRALYKSMTSYHDHTYWQDVYHPSYRGIDLYVKFTLDDRGNYRLLSFKERTP